MTPRVHLLGTAILLASGCQKQVTIAVNLGTAACVDSSLPSSARALAAPLDGVDVLRFVTTINQVAQPPVDVPVGQDKISLPLIPFDQTARIDVFGLGPPTGSSATPPAVSFGSSSDFTIPSSTAQSRVALAITLRRTDIFSEQPAGNTGACAALLHPRAYHAQTLLSDGRVLIYGGLQFPATVNWTKVFGIPPQPTAGTSYLDDAEIFDPATGQFTAAGAFTDPAGVVVGARAFASVITSTAVDGGAAVLGGETPTTPDGGLVGAANGAEFGPPDTWETRRFVSAHAHGCLAVDSSGHPMVAGGIDQNGIVTPAGEFVDPTVWPPGDRATNPVDAGTVEARADQACSGLLGKLGSTATLVVEAGGFTTDATGQNAALLGDLFFYQFPNGPAPANPTFSPLTINGRLAIAQLTAGPRSRAKATAFVVTDLNTGNPSDAMWISGGLTCDNPSDAGCFLTFLDGGTSGQLGSPITSYLPQAMEQTEILAFPYNQGIADITVVAGPNLLTPRLDHCAVTLQDGRALILGGLGFDNLGNFGTLTDARYTQIVPGADAGPIQIPTLTPVAAPLRASRAGMACTVLRDGSVLVTGGYQTTAPLAASSTQAVQMLGSVEIYMPLPASITAAARN